MWLLRRNDGDFARRRKGRIRDEFGNSTPTFATVISNYLVYWLWNSIKSLLRATVSRKSPWRTRILTLPSFLRTWSPRSPTCSARTFSKSPRISPIAGHIAVWPSGLRLSATAIFPQYLTCVSILMSVVDDELLAHSRKVPSSVHLWEVYHSERMLIGLQLIFRQRLWFSSPQTPFSHPTPIWSKWAYFMDSNCI